MSTPWSANALRRLGRCIREEATIPPGVPDYLEVMLWYNDLAATVQKRIADNDWFPILGSTVAEVTSRPKTIDTLRDKLKRDTSTPLPNIQDVAGVRFEAEMTLDQQNAVVNEIIGMFGHDASAIRDLRTAPHSGYRAVHVWLRLEGRVEVQVRTHLQGNWANMYESAADFLGRGIRYDGPPNNPAFVPAVEALRGISLDEIAAIEKNRNEIEHLEESVASAIIALDLLASSEDVDSLRARNNATMSRISTLKTNVLEQEASLKDKIDRLRKIFEQSRTP